LHAEAASGVVLLVCTIAALVLANSSWGDTVAAFWKMKVALSIGSFQIAGDIGHLVINDGLMTIFFFVVGLEIKREIVSGELADPRKALLPVVGAIGGLVGPAIIYLGLQAGQPGQRGWPVPMATDIAFVVGILALFGRRVPFGLKIFLLTLAIVDDLVAVLIVAFLFTESIAWNWLMIAGIGFATIVFLNRIGVRQIRVYLCVGVVIWFGFLKSGIHPTIAGALLGLLTPATALLGKVAFAKILDQEQKRLRKIVATDEKVVPSSRLKVVTRELASPLHRLEVALHPWVAFVILPLFALSNAGVRLDPTALMHPVAIAVAAGLVLGKPLGILAACAITIRLGLTQLPEGVSWRMMVGGACLAGIGFTMALFLNSLAFPVDDYPIQTASGKIGTLTGSVISVILGATFLLASRRTSKPE